MRMRMQVILGVNLPSHICLGTRLGVKVPPTSKLSRTPEQLAGHTIVTRICLTSACEALVLVIVSIRVVRMPGQRVEC